MAQMSIQALVFLLLGQVALVVPILLLRSKQFRHFIPLAIFLMSCAYLSLEPLVSSLSVKYFQYYVAFVFPILFLLMPALHIYLCELTRFDTSLIKPLSTSLEQPPNSEKKITLSSLSVSLPVLIGVIACGLVLLLPTTDFQTIFIDDVSEEAEAGLALTVVLVIFATLVAWFVQVCIFAILMFKQLLAFRRQLKHYYSNLEHKSLHWFSGIIPYVLLIWLFLLLTVLFSHWWAVAGVGQQLLALLLLILVWSLSYFGLMQEPPFLAIETEIVNKVEMLVTEEADLQQAEKTESEGSQPQAKNKYQRSALSKEQSMRIAEKIKQAMEQDKLYLDAGLTLQKLASHLVVSPNYLSQTLNETLDVNFFDYVNQWRVEAAKPLILENRETVLTIALHVGFNARSSFYKAFKKETGETPSSYRNLYIQ